MISVSGRFIARFGFTIIRRGSKRYGLTPSLSLPPLIPSLSLHTSPNGSDMKLSLSLLHESIAFDMFVILEMTSLRRIHAISRILSRSFGNFRKSSLGNDSQYAIFRHLFLFKIFYLMFGTIDIIKQHL